jgi:hypothetical protein
MFGNLTVEVVRKARSGKLQHPTKKVSEPVLDVMPHFKIMQIIKIN